MKTFSNTPMSAIAQMAYDYAVYDAEQKYEHYYDGIYNDPRCDVATPTQDWECMIRTDLLGIPVYIDASFRCPTTSTNFDNERCDYFLIEYRGTTPEQDDIFDAYRDALYYELQKIVGHDCDLCVE